MQLACHSNICLPWQLITCVVLQVSKKRAAEKMLEELKKLPPQSPTNMAASMARLKRKANPGKKKTRNLIKVYQQVSYEKTFCKHIGQILLNINFVYMKGFCN
jgi:hypothetical protein